jgi:hypothetical protein
MQISNPHPSEALLFGDFLATDGQASRSRWKIMKKELWAKRQQNIWDLLIKRGNPRRLEGFATIPFLFSHRFGIPSPPVVLSSLEPNLHPLENASIFASDDLE